MILTTVQSMTSTALMNGILGVDGLFFVLGVIQIIGLFVFLFSLKETQGLKP